MVFKEWQKTCVSNMLLHFMQGLEHPQNLVFWVVSPGINPPWKPRDNDCMTNISKT
jgi:hypothetical protein